MTGTSMTVAGLFAGIGGIEEGLHRAGHRTIFLNEIDERARAVLAWHFSEAELTQDIRSVRSLPDVDILTAGFPCTDISQAGRKVGITGEASGLVDEVFRLLRVSSPNWLVLENVSYLLRLGAGDGMRYLVDSLEDLGFRWAYRVVDARSFGLPQRRQRVLFVASRTEDPRRVLFADESGEADFEDPIGEVEPDRGYGFYWTEGLRGLGWVHDAVPTIKGGSTIGIPSPPAIWFPNTGEVGTPHIEDGERLQGFPVDWTDIDSSTERRLGYRWKQVGNAVSVPMSEWLGNRLAEPGQLVEGDWNASISGKRWPLAGYGGKGIRRKAPVGMRPLSQPFALRKFLDLPLKPLSLRATNGFLSRAERSKLRFADGFLEALHAHARSVAESSLR
ncbi:DNA cytosine methyltransferase [Ornithinimicrobium avium]|uniref:Cytosine-specific methyltransferase n=1 Tax=Ornithinimicrobium avium TaxID=2283195 RepID=A0A345NKF2_9MICO|nr:DNA cytosine methyltransferase [Ornithinimicrobium avium]AXH95510.1 DNA cytosine methyltransferase [Ornithinimicrobium avium]